MIKIVKDFLPKPLFKRLLAIVEDELFNWEWQNNTIQNPYTLKGDNNFKLGKLIYSDPRLDINANGDYFEVRDKFKNIFQTVADFQNEIKPFKKLVKLKLNLYPNQGEQIKHGRHVDISITGKPDESIITSVFNFHTCNGYTVIDENDKEQIIPSIANQIVIFDNAYHYGVTQSDIPRRIVLNMNVAI